MDQIPAESQAQTMELMKMVKEIQTELAKRPAGGGPPPPPGPSPAVGGQGGGQGGPASTSSANCAEPVALKDDLFQLYLKKIGLQDELVRVMRLAIPEAEIDALTTQYSGINRFKAWTQLIARKLLCGDPDTELYKEEGNKSVTRNAILEQIGEKLSKHPREEVKATGGLEKSFGTIVLRPEFNDGTSFSDYARQVLTRSQVSQVGKGALGMVSGGFLQGANEFIRRKCAKMNNDRQRCNEDVHCMYDDATNECNVRKEDEA